MEQLTILPNATPEQREAAAMHFEIIQAAQMAANSLLVLGRKLKRMRDSGRYKDLGFSSFGEYTEAAVGIKQRQAYNYIRVVESLPAQLIEENAAAGVTKLALLAKLNQEDREDLTGDNLAKITVEELEQLIKERDAMAQQLSIFQQEDQAEIEAEVEAEPVDVEEIRRQAVEETRRAMQAAFDKERAEIQEANRLAVNSATMAAEKAAAAEIRKATDAAEKAAAKETEKKVKAAREEARAEAMADLERQNAEELNRLRESAAQEKERAETLARQLQLSKDEDGVRFAMLFEQMQEKVEAMQAMANAMATNGKQDMAAKYMGAMRGALEAILSNLSEGE